MSQSNSVAGHLVDVTAIIVLGFVYVFALTVGTVGTLLVREIKSIGSAGARMREWVRDGTGPTS